MNLETAIQSKGFKDPKQKVVVNIMYTAYQVKNAISKSLKVYGLTAEQYNVLRILKGKHPEKMCVRDIAGRMIEHSSNIPRIIDRLVAKRLVVRSVSVIDKRETVTGFTQNGLQTLEVVTNVVEDTVSAICGLTISETKMLNDLLDKFRINE